MNGMHITWELIRNVKFQPIPELLNQNLHFNKILRGNCMYILVWGALVCDTSSLLKRTSLELEPYPFLCEKHNAWHTMWAQKLSSEWVNKWTIYFTSWWGKRTHVGYLHLHNCWLIELVQEWLKKGTYFILSPGRLSGSLLLGLHLVSLRYLFFQQSINQPIDVCWVARNSTEHVTTWEGRNTLWPMGKIAFVSLGLRMESNLFSGLLNVLCQ